MKKAATAAEFWIREYLNHTIINMDCYTFEIGRATDGRAEGLQRGQDPADL